ncbi:Uu.00g132210.m01.CDS01 [Anthostomella pinea]|uniref:Pectinesterase n=1 Tax=Anthostomella pinea TaxID=933095 RepID=A0AAI8VDQ9_9PEZI|nr:Uu.00g132210.m01.CDS01 [Anthostomella pinea]
MNSLLVGLAFVASVLAEGRTSAPDGCLNVAQSGGDYSTIQSAVDSLSTTSSDAQCVFVNPGTYSEQVLVSARSAQLTFYGYTDDTTSYADNQATISYNLSQADGLSNDLTGTLRIKATNFKMYNINVNNGYGEGSQAIALSAYADSGYYGCAFTGFQDTLLSNVGNQYYAGCMIQGATDYIFGQEAAAWFEQCDLRVLARSLGYITANGEDTADGTSIYVLNNCDIAAADGNTVPEGAYYLGRPWGDHAKVVFQNTAMSAVINEDGWHIWNTGDERTDNVLFGEYNNSGVGAAGPRVDFATILDSAYAIADVLGDGYASAGYYDASYL